jgi:hypothetical protein
VRSAHCVAKLPKLALQVAEHAVSRKARHIFEKDQRWLQNLRESHRLKNEACSLIAPALAVVIAKRLAWRANHKQIEVSPTQKLSADRPWIYRQNIVFKEPNSGMVLAVRSARDRVTVYGGYDPESSRFERGRNATAAAE